ncbi:MAG: 30S ribosomal protein S6 [Bacteroidales bacterium]|nr:30S ribosomal protein S6 [Bacteroidales bacterium]MCF8454732.1 30S ribosomal protein S6 [Bacteroidales bacterium]
MDRRYETVFIMTPVLSDVQMKEAVQKFKDLIESSNGKVVHEEHWGLRKLAYPIQKKTTGFYHLMEFDVDPEVIQKLETAYRRDERIIRFLTFKMEKYAIEYSEKKKSRNAEKVEEEK